MHQEVPSSFPSIMKTLAHILEAQGNWYAIISGTNNNPVNTNELVFSNIFKGLTISSSKFIELVNSMNEDELLQHIRLEAPIFLCDMPKYEYLLHVVNHSTYHRGQIVTIAHNLGITDAPMTDYNIFRSIS